MRVTTDWFVLLLELAGFGCIVIMVVLLAYEFCFIGVSSVVLGAYGCVVYLMRFQCVLFIIHICLVVRINCCLCVVLICDCWFVWLFWVFVFCVFCLKVTLVLGLVFYALYCLYFGSYLGWLVCFALGFYCVWLTFVVFDTWVFGFLVSTVCITVYFVWLCCFSNIF